MVLLGVLLFQTFTRNRLAGLFIGGLFFLLNTWMMLALTSELLEFEAFNNRAWEMLGVGLGVFLTGLAPQDSKRPTQTAYNYRLMRIRAYQESDRAALLGLLQLNIPKYFAPSEEQDFEEYLDQHLEHYFVVEEQGRLIGSGGINYNSDGTQARISWDFLHPDFQRRGIGKKLTLHRIQEIKKNPGIRRISVRTSQLAYTFYQKLGFELQKVVKDFWSEGFDLYEMELDL